MFFDDSKDYLTHYHEHYKHKVIEYKCCKNFFTNLKTFSKHLSNSHFLHNDRNDNSIEFNQVSLPIINSNEDNHLLNAISNNENFKRELIKILLKFLCDKSSSRKSTVRIADTMMNFFHQFLRTLFNSYPFEQNSTFLTSTHFQFFNFLDLNSSHLSEYQVTKHLKEMNILIEFDEIQTSELNNLPNSSVETKISLIEFYDFLSRLFSNELFLEKFVNFYDSLQTSTEFTNVLQSDFWKEKISKLNLSSDCICVPLIIYFDGFETLNPIGFHTRAYAIDACYLKLAILPPELASKLDFIWPLQFSFSTDVNTVGNEQTYSRLIEKLNELFSGAIFIKHSIYKEVKFLVAFIAGDNLGLHKLHEFVCNFSTANKFCRFCTLDRNQIKVEIVEVKDSLRNIQNYHEDLQKKNFRLTGLHNESVFCQLLHYHPMENLYVDPAHDILEGIARYVMPRIISNFISRKLFTLDFLNNAIRNFNYPFNAKIMDTITKENLASLKIKSSACEMLSLILNFNLIFGSLIPENDEVWELYLYLRKILLFTLKHVLDDELKYTFQQIITSFLKLYQKLFGELKYKFHLLTHYPRIVQKFGPISSLSTLRFESKHKIFKDSINVSANRKNILKSLAKQSQYIYADFLLNFNFTDSFFEYKEHEEVSKESLKEEGFLIDTEDKIYATKKFIYLGREYKEDIAISCFLDDELFLAKINKIYTSNKKFYLKCEKLTELYTNYHYDCYQFEEQFEKEIIWLNFDDVKDFSLSKIYIINTETFINISPK